MIKRTTIRFENETEEQQVKTMAAYLGMGMGQYLRYLHMRRWTRDGEKAQYWADAEQAAITRRLEEDTEMTFYEQDRTTQVNQIRELAANIAENLGEGTAEELVEYALSEEGRDAWGVNIKLDDHDRGLLIRFVGESLD